MQELYQDKISQLTKAFGEIVKKHRTQQRKTIYKISAEAGVPKESWREYELGIRNFRFATLWQISEALDISVPKLMEELHNKMGKDFSITDLN